MIQSQQGQSRCNVSQRRAVASIVLKRRSQSLGERQSAESTVLSTHGSAQMGVRISGCGPEHECDKAKMTSANADESIET